MSGPEFPFKELSHTNMCVFMFLSVCVRVRVPVKRCRHLEVFYSQKCMHQEEVELKLDEEHNGNKGVFVCL